MNHDISKSNKEVIIKSCRNARNNSLLFISRDFLHSTYVSPSSQVAQQSV